MARARTPWVVVAAVVAAGIVVVACCSRGGDAPQGDAVQIQLPHGAGAGGGSGSQGKLNLNSVPETSRSRARAERDGTSLDVTVRTTDARRVPGATVVVIPYDAATGKAVEEKALVARADDDGRAAFADLAEGVHYEVCVRADGLTPTGRKFVAGGVRETVVELRKIAHHRIRVVDPEGLAIPDTRVTITRPVEVENAGPGLHRVAEATTDADGWMEFDLEPSADAKYLAWFDPPRDAPFGLPVVTGTPWIPGEPTLLVARGWWARGVVRSPDGKPLPGVALHTQGGKGTLLSERTGADGRFAIYDLPRGTSVGVRADVRCATVPTTDAAADADAKDDAFAWTYLRVGDPPGEVVVDPGAFVVVKMEYVLDIEDAGASALVWTPRAADAAPARIAANPLGDPVLVGGLDPARSYTFTAGPTFFGKVAVAADVRPAGQTLSLSFVPGVPTRGVARFPAGAADGHATRAGVEVQAWTPDAPRVLVATVTTNDDGTFEFPGLPPGRWVLRVDGVDPWGETEAAAGAEGIVIELNRPGHRPLRAGAPR